MTVQYRCKICGREHQSPVAFSTRESFEPVNFRAKQFQCQATGRSASYVKKDMRWK